MCELGRSSRGARKGEIGTTPNAEAQSRESGEVRGAHTQGAREDVGPRGRARAALGDGGGCNVPGPGGQGAVKEGRDVVRPVCKKLVRSGSSSDAAAVCG